MLRPATLALTALIAISACTTEDQTEAACQQQYQTRLSITRLEFDEYVNQAETLNNLSQQSADGQLQSLGETINETAVQWQETGYTSGDLLTLNLEANQSYTERCLTLGYQQGG